MDLCTASNCYKNTGCNWPGVYKYDFAQTKHLNDLKSSFLVLIGIHPYPLFMRSLKRSLAAFLSPPAEPFIAVFEREMSNLIFVAVSFGRVLLINHATTVPLTQLYPP